MAQVNVSCCVWNDHEVWMAGDRRPADPRQGRGLVPDDGEVSDRAKTLMEMRAAGQLTREQLLRRYDMDEDR